MTTVFLGGGRITSALIAGLRLAKDRRRIVVFDRNPHKLQRLQRQYGVVPERDLHRAVKNADQLIVAVRPDAVAALLRDVGEIGRPLAIVSLAAGIPLATLRRSLAGKVYWVRAMPSPACRSGLGLTALAFDRGFPSSSKRAVTELFARVGPVIEIPEAKFDAFTVTYSCSHGYHALSTLAEAAVRLGLDRKIALMASAHALADGLLAWRKGSESLDSLMAEAATPGGIAACVTQTADRAGYKTAVQKGLSAGIRRAQANAK